MNRLIGIILICGLCWQCGGDQSTRAEARAAIEESRSNIVSTTQPQEMEAGVPVTTQTPPTVSDQLVMTLGNARVASGSPACLPVSVTDFQDLIGLQYTIRWDTTQLVYKGIRALELKDLSVKNFGLRFVDKGIVAFSWIDLDLQGVNIPDGSTVYEICFDTKASIGTTAQVRFDNRPVPYEVINKAEEILQFRGQDGMIQIQ